MRKYFNGWACAALWFVFVAAFCAGYLANQISRDTLVFAEGCALAVGGITLVFWGKINQPPEIVEQILYTTEHPKRS